MKNQLATTVLPQIDELLAKYEILTKSSQYADHRDISHDDAHEFVTAGMAAIHRAAGAHSQYAVQTAKSIEVFSPVFIGKKVLYVGGALKALRHDVAAGYLVSVEELVHADIFTDFLEMAQHLFNEGYKDAAAVLVGGVLEEHLRKLCTKNGILTESTDSKGDVKPRKVETMNTELAAANVYSKGDQKSVTAWYDLRTKAAHGHYNEYTQQQVELLLQSVRDFLARHPA